MNKTEATKLTAAFSKDLGKPVRITASPDPEVQAVKLEFPVFSRYNSKYPFVVWMYRFPHSKKVQVSDGGKYIRQTTDHVELYALSLLVHSYGLSLMEDKSIADLTDRPLKERLSSYLQCMVALDGILRTWQLLKGQVSDRTAEASS